MNDLSTVFAALAAAYPKWGAKPETFGVYEQALADLQPAAVARAAMKHVRTNQYPPTVAELRALVRGKGMDSEEAWLEVADQIRSVGWNGKPTFSSPEVEKAVSAVGGWRSLCSQPSSEMVGIRAHFMRCFGSYSGRVIDREEEAALDSIDSFNAKELKQIDDDERREIERA